MTTIRDNNTLGAETVGLLHLMGAHFAARDNDAAAAADHLDEAGQVALLTGERDGLQQHFGPTDVKAWRVAIGPHFDLARSWAQAEGDRDSEALRALDTADRLAPLRMRNDPTARDHLVLTLDRRAVMAGRHRKPPSTQVRIPQQRGPRMGGNRGRAVRRRASDNQCVGDGSSAFGPLPRAMRSQGAGREPDRPR